MCYLQSILRAGALAAAAFVLTPSSLVTSTATVATITAVTVVTTSRAEAGRPKVRDHRSCGNRGSVNHPPKPC